jgi:hypothetical protein
MHPGGVKPVRAKSVIVDHSSEDGRHPADKLGYTRRSRDAWCPDDLAIVPEHLRPGEEETLDLILRKKIFLVRIRPSIPRQATLQRLTLVFH